jgi:hypothetical protein
MGDKVSNTACIRYKQVKGVFKQVHHRIHSHYKQQTYKDTCDYIKVSTLGYYFNSK